jgi:hypothetical protein
MTLFPPWLYVYRYQHTAVTFGVNDVVVITDKWQRHAGYHLVFRDLTPPTFPDIDSQYISARLDRERLITQIAGVILPTILLCLAFSREANSK